MPLLWLSTTFLIGLLAAAGLQLPWQVWLGCAIVGLLAAVFEQRWLSRRTYRLFVPLPVGLVLAFFFLGGLRGEIARPPLTALDLATYNDSGRARLTGEVISAPDRRETSTLLKVRVSQLQPEGGQPLAVCGLVMVRLAPGALFRYGDRLVLDGVPQTPPEDETFSYRDYLARQGILTYINQPQVYLAGRGRTNLFWSFTYGLRERAYRLVNRYYPAPESALLAGILLGLDQDLPEGLAQAYRDTGTAHVIAISGFNMSILAALFLGLFGRVLPRGWAALAAILALAFYSLLVGANPAVVRAALMGAAAVFGGLVGRRQSGINTLVFTAALMCAFNPFLPWDVSFQLSFSATLGLILYAEPVELAFRRWADRHFSPLWAYRLAGPVTEFGLLTLAAQATTLPVTLYHFQRLSLSTLLANPLVLPVQPLLMVLGGLSLLVGLVFAPLGQLAAWLAWPLAAYTNRMVSLLGSIPGGVLVLDEIPLWLPIGLYAGLFLLTLAPRARLPLAKLARPAVGLAVLALLAGFTWRCVLSLPDGRLHLQVMATQGGPALLIQAPSGETALLGGSSGARELSQWLGEQLSPVSRRLDVLLLADSSAKSLAGLPTTLERFPPANAWWAILAPGHSTAARLEAALQAQGVATGQLQPGQAVLLADQVRLTPLAQTEQGAAVLIEMGELRVLLPGGVPPQEIRGAGGVFLLVLGERDLETTAPAEWDALGAQAIAAPDGDLPAHWLSLAPSSWLEVVSDGTTAEIRVGN